MRGFRNGDGGSRCCKFPRAFEPLSKRVSGEVAAVASLRAYEPLSMRMGGESSCCTVANFSAFGQHSKRNEGGGLEKEDLSI